MCDFARVDMAFGFNFLDFPKYKSVGGFILCLIILDHPENLMGLLGKKVGSSYVFNCWKTAFFKHCMQLIFMILNVFRINLLFLYMRN